LGKLQRRRKRRETSNREKYLDSRSLKCSEEERRRWGSKSLEKKKTGKKSEEAGPQRKRGKKL